MTHGDVFIRTYKAAWSVGAASRWVEVAQTYTPRAERDLLVQQPAGGPPAFVPAGTLLAEYRWSNRRPSEEVIHVDRDLAVAGAPHFCCTDGVALADQLAQKWRHLNIINESALTAIHDAAVVGVPAGLVSALIAGLGTGAMGAIGAIGGALTGVSASFAKGALLGLKHSALVGAAGAAKGAVKGALWGGHAVIGGLAGGAVGVTYGLRQYCSLDQVKKMERLLVDTITTFVRFSSGAMAYDIARDRVAVAMYRLTELCPDEERRRTSPLHQACVEVRAILNIYGRSQEWT